MKIHEYQAKELFREYGIETGEEYAVKTPEEAAVEGQQGGRGGRLAVRGLDSQQGAGRVAAEGVAQAAVRAQGADASAEIAAAFEGLGMDAARAGCYGETLAGELAGEDLRTAINIVEDAESANDVKIAVVTAGPTIVGAFSAADAKCPEGMQG